ncbi:hypothetical protein I314_03581 [Cryptococcus bacillisporus CA1873]|uniref:Uncharacterized protein n=1 Tax=Cryptococcus bacillisporus CA1873 TaxID=1296111 RepID=A0ABR5BAN8_CRYGA|nr:hypothetical protein I314_03581 [Cryptococcus bacillisporus CA1873]|eukprot:KIR60292.1 hypothetical protein I314_03581 [Cryptococcus gattii CA1873]
MAPSDQPPPASPWMLPPSIPSRLVYPDISPAVLSKDGGDKPHLYPSLIALHKHRHALHGIPIPAGGPTALPEPQTRPQTQGQGVTDMAENSTASNVSEDILPKEVAEVLQQLRADVRGSDADVNDQSSASGRPHDGNVNVGKGIHAAEEWFTWMFTEEEEARRRAYLPLA